MAASYSWRSKLRRLSIVREILYQSSKQTPPLGIDLGLAIVVSISISTMYQRFFITMAIAGRHHLKSRPAAAAAAARRLFAGCTTNSNNRLLSTAAAGSSSLLPAAARPRKSSNTTREEFSRKLTSLANFAVHTQNHRENMNFQLVRIVDVNTMLVGSVRYDLTLELTTPGTSDPRRYRASVCKKFDGKIVLYGWETIDEIGFFSPKITDLANFAVNTLNRFSSTNLQLVRILKASTDPAFGLHFILTLELTANGASYSKVYRMYVYEQHDGTKLLFDWESADQCSTTKVDWESVDQCSTTKPKVTLKGPRNTRFLSTAAVSFPSGHGSQFHAEVRDAETNELVNDLAKFAVEKYNQEENAHLRFLEVLHATCSDVVSGMSYNIMMELDDGYDKGRYVAEVLREGDGKKYLLEFYAYL